MPSFNDLFEHRARLLKRLLAALFLSLGVASAWAQNFPSKPIRLIAPYPPGGFNDVTGRILAQALAERFGQSVIVENKPGASTIIGAEAVMRSSPDGHTLFYAGSSTFTANPVLLPKLPYDPVKSFAPVGIVCRTPMLLLAHPSFPASNLKELVGLLASKPGQYAYGSFGSGSISNFAGELLNSILGVRMMHVPYKGSSFLMNALVAGEIPLSVDTLVVAAPQVRSGRIKAIAAATAKRTSLLPYVPTVAESGYSGLDVYAWTALVAPAGTPEPVLKRLRDEVNKSTATKDLIERFAAIGVEPVVADGDDFIRLVQRDIRNFTLVAKEANIKPD